MKYAFIHDHSPEFNTRLLCRMMNVHPRGYYAWLKEPKSKKQIEDARLVGLIKQFWLESGCIYGYRKIFMDLRDDGETCGKNRVYRLMKNEGLKAQIGYKKPRSATGPINHVAENLLQQQFTAKAHGHLVY